MIDKEAIRAAFRESLVARIDALEAEVGSARSGTRVDGDHRPSNRGERAAVSSQGYLAHGINQRLEGLKEDLRLLDGVAPGARDRVAAGALVTLDDGDEARTYLVLPGGLGDAVDGVFVVSPDAPVVRPLLGAREGDAATLRRGDRDVELVVEEIA